ncbi:MAG: cupin domain-containing protein [Candidatus Promineifilaceae bacterium]|nr:cupin domain-containing protein [Candidatus Promineifilaceae bacterium]
MAKSGQLIENPMIGDRVLFRKTAQETNGELLEMVIYAQPAAAGPPVHIHPQSEETFTVLEGRLDAQVNGRTLQFGPGESFHVAPGVPHTWWNSSEGEARVLVTFSPASRMETFLETMYGLAKDGHTDDHGVPGFLRLAVIAPTYFDVNHLADPPLALQKALFGVLRPIGRLLGYQSDYPYPYDG